MGASASKTARAAGSAASRKYPTRAPGVATTNVTSQPPAAAQASGPGPTVHPQPQATESRTEAIHSDFQDPDLAARLSQLGPVQPNPTYSNSSTFHQPQSPSQPQAMQFSPSTSHLISKNLSPSGANPAPSESHDPQTTQSNFQPSASNPSQSIFPNTASNPAITLLEARKRLAEEADTEFSNIGRRGAKGRTFLDVVTIRQVLMLRDQKGMADQDIERQLGLGSGVVSRLGEKGVIGVTQY